MTERVSEGDPRRDRLHVDEAGPQRTSADVRPSSRPNTTRREGLQTQSPRSNPPVPAPAVSADRARPEPETIAERSPVRWGLWFATLALLIGAASAGWWYWTGSARAPAGDQARSGAAPPQGRAAAAGRIPVDVAQVTVSDVPIFYESLGTVQAFNNVTIRSRVDGEVMEIAFEEGQTVQEGALLARVDPRPYKAALDQALARKAQNEATLAATRLDLERTQKLASQSFASQQQLDQQTATLGSQTAQLASDQAAIDNARTQLDYATIRAPISGRTGLRLVDRGNIVRAGDATGIVEIAQLQPISVLFTAPEGQLPAIAAAKRGGDVRVQALAPDGRTILGEGVLALINNTVDPASGTVRLKATFPNAEDRLWPGLSVNTRLLVQTLRAAVNIPEAALLRGQNELFVYVVGADDKAEKRLLKVGAFSEGRVVIEDGLRAGEKVVVAGQSRLLPGSQIQTGPSGPGREDERAAGLAATPGSAP